MFWFLNVVDQSCSVLCNSTVLELSHAYTRSPSFSKFTQYVFGARTLTMILLIAVVVVCLFFAWKERRVWTLTGLETEMSCRNLVKTNKIKIYLCLSASCWNFSPWLACLLRRNLSSGRIEISCLSLPLASNECIWSLTLFLEAIMDANSSCDWFLEQNY